MKVKKEGKPITRKARIKRTIENVVIGLCAILAVCFFIWNVHANFVPSNNPKKATDAEVTFDTTDFELPSGYYIKVPATLEQVKGNKFASNCTYLAEKADGNIPQVSYFVLETPVSKDSSPKPLSIETLPESITKDIATVCTGLIKGGSFSPAYDYDCVDVNGYNLVAMNGDFSMIGASERKVYSFPDGVELDSKTGEPKGTKPDGSPWTLKDAKVTIEAQPVDLSCKAKIMTGLFDQEYVTVVLMWNPKLVTVSEDNAQGLVTIAASNISKERVDIENGKN